MAKKKMPHFKIPSGPRYRFVLEEDLRQVKVCAFTQGILNAHAQLAQKLNLTEQGVQAAAIEAAILTEQEVKGGKQGCNEPARFREVFSDWCGCIHTAILAYWERDPQVYEMFRKRPAQQQVANAFHMADLYLDRVEMLRVRNEPIVFER